MNTARRIELGALLALAFVLPLYEAPKSIAWAVFVVAWLVNRARARNFGGRWDAWDWLLGAWIASGFVVASCAGLHYSEWRGTADLVRNGVLLWLLRRSDYSPREQRRILYGLLAGVVVGLALSAWRLWHGADALELNSVGHVNHTAIYIAILLGAAAAWAFSGGGTVAAAALVLLLLSLIVSASRAAIGVGLGMLVVLAAAWWPRSRRPLGAVSVLVAATLATAWLGGAEFIQKQLANAQAQNVLSYRDGIWRAALVAWERYPVCGIGIDNYKLVNLERLKAWRAEAGKDFEPQRYVEFPHAHSLYIGTLAERGVIGALALGAVLAAWLVWLVRYRPRSGPPSEATDDDWLWWGAAAAAWSVTIGVGFVNTTLHHEHGMLAAMLLGVWLSRVRHFER
jgi:O-antigen ligase